MIWQKCWRAVDPGERVQEGFSGRIEDRMKYGEVIWRRLTKRAKHNAL